MSLLRAINDDERFVGGGGRWQLVATRLHGVRATVTFINTGLPLFSSVCYLYGCVYTPV